MTAASERDPVRHLPRAHGPALGHARFRATPEDFQVDERIEIPEHAGGAHWWLRLRKRDMNTKDVARLLTTLGSARIRQVSYAGLKDRRAVTSQWFSLPIEHLDPETLGERLPAAVQLLDWRRARHAIRRGGLKGNRFRIRLRDCALPEQALRARIDAISTGVPNYFGAQRFGIEGGNLRRARAMFDGTLGRTPRFERGLYLSAARAQLFNAVLARRVSKGSWNRLIDGEAVILDGSRSCFPLPAPDTGQAAELPERLARFDIHPSGPLHGIGDTAVGGACAELEQEVLAANDALASGLEALRLRAERRSLRLRPLQLSCYQDAQDLLLSFELPPGTFATMVLRELVETTTANPTPG